MKLNYLICCALFPFCSACGPSSIPASQITSVSEYEDGVAIITTTDNNYYFVDSELVPVNGCNKFYELSEFKNGYAVAKSSTVNGNCTIRNVHIVGRKGDIVETFDSNATPIILPGGHAWVLSDSGIALKDLSTGKILLEESAWVETESPSGTVVLARRRKDKHPDGYEYAYLIEFMMVDKEGRIIVPWGRIGYIGELSNGLAVASNSAQGGIRDFSDGIERYSRSRIHNPKYGYINEYGEWIIPEKFFIAEKFNESGYAMVVSKKYALYSDIEYNYINRSGKILAGNELNSAIQSFSK